MRILLDLARGVLRAPGRSRLIVGALACAAVTAFAETTVMFYLGTSLTRNSDVHIRQPGSGTDAIFRNVSWESRSYEFPLYYGIRINHFFKDRPNVGIGLEFTHDKAYARTGQVVHVDGTWDGVPVNEDAPMDQRVQSFSMSHGVNIVALNAYYRGMHENTVSYPHGRWQPYAGAGLTYYVLHPENTVDGQNNDESYQGGGFGYQLLGGLNYRITPRGGVFAEVKHNRGKVEVDTAAGGRAETELKSSQLLTGIGKGF
jgi:opacity protein-like surface antigen